MPARWSQGVGGGGFEGRESPRDAGHTARVHLAGACQCPAATCMSSATSGTTGRMTRRSGSSPTATGPGPSQRCVTACANQPPLDCNRSAMDDDGLVARVAAGDDTALRELFSRHAPWLAARLRAALPAAEVEDVLQETFLAVWRGADGYRPGGAAAAPPRPGRGRAARRGHGGRAAGGRPGGGGAGTGGPGGRGRRARAARGPGTRGVAAPVRGGPPGGGGGGAAG